MFVCKSIFSKTITIIFRRVSFLLFSSKGKPRDDKVSFHTLYRRCTLYISISCRYPPDAPRPWIAGPRSGEQELLLGENWAKRFRTGQFYQLVPGAFEAYRWYHLVFECFLFVEKIFKIFVNIAYIWVDVEQIVCSRGSVNIFPNCIFFFRCLADICHKVDKS